MKSCHLTSKDHILSSFLAFLFSFSLVFSIFSCLFCYFTSYNSQKHNNFLRQGLYFPFSDIYEGRSVFPIVVYLFSLQKIRSCRFNLHKNVFPSFLPSFQDSMAFYLRNTRRLPLQITVSGNHLDLSLPLVTAPNCKPTSNCTFCCLCLCCPW